MNFQFTKEQEKMRHKVRDFAQNEVAKEIDRMESEDRFPIELIKRMGELNLMGIPIPKKYGGSGMSFTSYIIAIHELSKVSATLGVILSVHTSVGTNPILYFGNKAQKEYYLPKLASGKYLGAFALTETSAGSDVGNLKMTARKEEQTYILNGSKTFITNGGVADTYLTFARTMNVKGAKGISAFIVEASTPGLSIGKRERKMGLHGSPTVELIFDQCIVPESQLCGEENDGFKIAMANLNVGRIGIAAQALGIAEASLEHALAYVKKSETCGKPISSQQGISFKLADMTTAVEAAKLLVYQAASMEEKGLSCRKEVSMAKLYASKTAVRNAIEAVQICGEHGFKESQSVERFFRDSKITEIYEGTSEMQHIVIAKELLRD